MKKYIILLTLLTFSFSGIQAQEIFHTLLDKANTIVNENSINDYNTKVYYFYSTALNYLQTKIKPKNTAQYQILDEQALAMQTFVSNFIKWMAETKDTSLRKKGIQIFINASADHPFFNDKDKETVESFINDPNYITPFRLDTDWVTASQVVQAKLSAIAK